MSNYSKHDNGGRVAAMSDQLLQQIVDELKGLRGETATTNQRLDQTVQRLDQTVHHLDGLHESFVVLQQGVGDIRRELQQIKDVLSDRVIWQNDTISIAT